MPGIQYFIRSQDKPIATAASPAVGLIKFGRGPWDAEHPQINEGALQHADDGSPGEQAKWASAAVIAGSLLGMVATICSDVGAISTQQMIGLTLPAVLLIGTGLTAGTNISASHAARRGYESGLQFGSNLGRLRSACDRGRGF